MMVFFYRTTPPATTAFLSFIVQTTRQYIENIIFKSLNILITNRDTKNIFDPLPLIAFRRHENQDSEKTLYKEI